MEIWQFAWSFLLNWFSMIIVHSLRLVEIESLSFFTWRVPWGGLVQLWISFGELDSCILSSHSPNIIDFHWLQDIYAKDSHLEILGTQIVLSPCMLATDSKICLGIHTALTILGFFLNITIYNMMSMFTTIITNSPIHTSHIWILHHLIFL